MNFSLVFLVFTLFLLINLISSGGHLDEHDGIVYLALTENMVIHNSWKLDPGLDTITKTHFDVTHYMNVQYFRYGETPPTEQLLNPMYIGAAPLLSFFAVPLYKLSLYLSYEPLTFVPFFLNSIILSITGLLIYFTSKEFFSIRTSFILGLLFSITSFAWPYTSSMYIQPLVGLTLIACLYFTLLHDRKHQMISSLLSGSFLGMMILAHPGHLILVPSFFIYCIYKMRTKKISIGIFISVFVLFLVIQGVLNEIRFNSFFDFGYGDQQTILYHNNLDGILGLIFSPGFGLLVNYPLSILFPISLFLMYRYISKSLALLFISVFISSWLFYGTTESPTWAGFGSWGPRYFLPILPFITIPIGILLERYWKYVSYRISIISLSSLGFFVNLLGILVWHMYGYSYGWAIDALWKSKDSFSIFAWSIEHSPFVLHLKLLLSDYLLKVPSLYQNDYHDIGLAPCRFDLFVYCEYGLIPLIGILIAIVTLFYFILKFFSKIKLEQK